MLRRADLLAPAVWSSLHPTLVELVRLIDRLRIELAASSGWPLLDVAELQILLYPEGGHYRRHLDVGKRGSRVVRRAVSLVIYLTPDEWEAAVDGGQLRVYSGTPLTETDEEAAAAAAAASAAAATDVQTFDVPPNAGTLVLFSSAAIWHEVLPTRRERLVVVGWLCEQ